MIKKRGTGAATTKKSGKNSTRKISEMPLKKVSRVLDIQKKNQIKNSFTGVPETDVRACFNRSTWSSAIKMQQLPLGTSHLIMGDSVVGVLQILRTAMILTVMAFVGTTVAQLYRMVELMNPGRNVDVIILIGPNNVSRSSESEECQWEETLACLLTEVWQKF